MKKIKVLAIDDEPIICQTLKLFLEEFQFTVDTAEDGTEGLELFTHNPYDIVITDLNMPGISGLEVVKRISKTSPSTPIIVASGADKVSDAVEAINAGAWDYIAKPMTDINVLRLTIEQAIEKANLKLENYEYQQHLEKLVLLKTKDLEHTVSELNEKREHLSLILNAISDMIFVTNLQGIVTMVNPVVSTILKQESSALIGMCIDDLFPQAQNRTLLTQSIKLLQLQETVITNNFYVTLQGHKRRYRITAKEIETEEASLKEASPKEKVVVVLTDISEFITDKEA